MPKGSSLCLLPVRDFLLTARLVGDPVCFLGPPGINSCSLCFSASETEICVWEAYQVVPLKSTFVTKWRVREWRERQRENWGYVEVQPRPALELAGPGRAFFSLDVGCIREGGVALRKVRLLTLGWLLRDRGHQRPVRAEILSSQEEACFVPQRAVMWACPCVYVWGRGSCLGVSSMFGGELHLWCPRRLPRRWNTWWQCSLLLSTVPCFCCSKN